MATGVAVSTERDNLIILELLMFLGICKEDIVGKLSGYPQ